MRFEGRALDALVAVRVAIKDELAVGVAHLGVGRGGVDSGAKPGQQLDAELLVARARQPWTGWLGAYRRTAAR